MNSAPGNIRTVLIALLRPTPMKAPLQDDSATASSERAEPCGEREGERDINCIPYSLCSPALVPVPSCSCVDDEPVMRIDRIDLNILAGVDQGIMAVRQVLRQLLQLIIVNRRSVTVRHALHQLLKLLLLVTVGGQQIVELELAPVLELMDEIGDDAVHRVRLERRTVMAPVGDGLGWGLIDVAVSLVTGRITARRRETGVLRELRSRAGLAVRRCRIGRMAIIRRNEARAGIRE